MTTQRKIAVGILVAAGAALTMAAATQQQQGQQRGSAWFEQQLKAQGLPIHPQGSIANTAETPIMLSPEAVSWGPPPPGLPQTLKAAVLEGDPKAQNKIYTVRVQFPAGSKIAAHFHPEDERITVLTGSFSCGMGEKFEEASAKAHGPGSFIVLPARQPHFAFAKTDTTVQISGVGPFGIVYMNPSDDPRKAGVGGAGSTEKPY